MELCARLSLLRVFWLQIGEPAISFTRSPLIMCLVQRLDGMGWIQLYFLGWVEPISCLDGRDGLNQFFIWFGG